MNKKIRTDEIKEEDKGKDKINGRDKLYEVELDVFEEEKDREERSHDIEEKKTYTFKYHFSYIT